MDLVTHCRLSCVLCMGWGGRVAGLGFVCNLLGMVLGKFFPLELFTTTKFSLFCMVYVI